MREEEIRRLIKIVEESNIGALEISRWGRTIKISKNAQGVNSINNSHPAPTASMPADAPSLSSPAEPNQKAEGTSPAAAVPASNGVEIKSPMVGTFYRAPAPDADPYVQVGSSVKKGQVLCIIEAMKLMNEIEAETDGKIIEILVENAQPVEYNQPLFRLEPS
ncbi:MAG: acetyl-CoA carboxylase biotin carboxyl carrier protein [bacterium]